MRRAPLVVVAALACHALGNAQEPPSSILAVPGHANVTGEKRDGVAIAQKSGRYYASRSPE